MAEPHSDEVFEYEEVSVRSFRARKIGLASLFHIMRTHQEKKKREENDPQLQEYMDIFSSKDAVLEQGIAKSFEQSVRPI